MSIRSNPLKANTSANFVNLSNSETLQDHVDPDYQKFIPSLLPIAQEVYESKPRISEGLWGFSFPIYPEVLSYAMKRMQRTKDGIAVEAAAAGGENSILLAAAGKTNKVFVNDILSAELARCRSLVKTLPKPMQKQLILTEGDCLDLLQKRPELTGKVDLFLNRNLIHFFDDKEQIKLAQEIGKMLKPGGQAIISTNASYAVHRENPSAFENHPKTTCAEFDQCILRIPGASSPTILYRRSKPAPSNSYTSDFKRKYLYERDPTNNWKWKVNQEVFMQLDPELRSTLQTLFATPKIKDLMKKENGSMKVEILTTQSRIYNEETLSAIFARQGFNIVDTYVTNYKGHVVTGQDKSTKGEQVGVIIEKPMSPKGVNFKIKEPKREQTPKAQKTSC